MIFLDKIVAILELEDRLSPDLTKTQKNIQRIGEDFQRAGRSITVGFSAPIGLASAAVVRFASQFEDSFTGVTKTVNGSAEELKTLELRLRSLASFGDDAIPIDVNDLNAIAEQAGQLGIELENIADFAKLTAGLSISAPSLTFEAAASQLATIRNLMELSLNETERFGAAVVDLGNNFNTTEAKLLNLTRRISGAAAIAGFTAAETAGIATALSALGEEAEAGGTALQKAFLNIVEAVNTGNENLSAFAATAGLSAKDFSALWRDAPVEAFKRFVTGLAAQGEDAIGTFDAIGLANERFIRSFLRLAARPDLLTEAIDVANVAFEKNTALVDEANKRYATFTSQLTLFLGKLREVAIELGNAFLPVLKQASEFLDPVLLKLRDLAQFFTNLPPPIHALVAVLAVLATALGPLVLVTGVFIAAWGQLVLVWPTVLAAIKGTIAILAGPAGWAVAIGAVLLAWKPTRDIILEIGTILTGVFKSAVSGIVTLIQKWWKETAEARRFAIELAKVIAKDLAGAIQFAWQWWKQLFTQARDWVNNSPKVRDAVWLITNAFASMKDVIVNLSRQILDFLGGFETLIRIAAAVVPGLDLIVDKMSEWVDTTRKNIAAQDAQKKAIDGLKSGISGAAAFLPGFSSLILEAAASVEQLGESGTDTAEDFSGPLKFGVEEVENALSRLKDELASIALQTKLIGDFGVSAEVAARAAELLADGSVSAAKAAVELARDLDLANTRLERMLELTQQIANAPLDQLGAKLRNHFGFGTDDVFDDIVLPGLSDEDLADIDKALDDIASGGLDDILEGGKKFEQSSEQIFATWVELGYAATDFVSLLDDDLASALESFISGTVRAVNAWRALEDSANGLEGALAGLEFGSAVSDALGLQNEFDYAGEGASAGGAIGGAIGGPTGAAIGTALGGVIGKLFDKAEMIAIGEIEVAAGQLRTQVSSAVGRAGEIFSPFINGLRDSLESVIDSLGGQLHDLQLGLELRISKGLEEDQFILNMGGLERTFDNINDAIAFAIAQAFRSGSVTGLSPEAEALITDYAIDTAEELDAAIALALRLERGRVGDAVFEVSQLFRQAFSDFEAAVSGGLDPSLAIMGAAASLHELRAELTGTQADAAAVAEQRRVAFNAELALMEAQIILLLEELRLRQQTIAVGSAGIDILHQSQDSLLGVAGSAATLADAMSGGLTPAIHGTVNAVGQGVTLMANAGAQAANTMAGAAGVIAGSAVAATNATASAASNLQAVLDSLPDIITPGELVIPTVGSAPRAPTGPSNADILSGFGDALAQLELEASLAGSGVVSLVNALQAMHATLDEAARAGASAEDLERFTQLTLQALEDDLLAPFIEIINNTNLSPFEQSIGGLFDQYEEAFQSAWNLANELGDDIEATFGNGGGVASSFEEEFNRLSGTVGEAFGIEFMEMLSGQLDSLSADGDLAGINELRTSLNELLASDLPAGLRLALETILDQVFGAIDVAAQRTHQELRQGLLQSIDDLANDFKQTSGRALRFGSQVADIRSDYDDLIESLDDSGLRINEFANEIHNLGQEADFAVQAVGVEFLESLSSIGITIPGLSERMLELQRAMTLAELAALATDEAFLSLLSELGLTLEGLAESINEGFNAAIEGVGATSTGAGAASAGGGGAFNAADEYLSAWEELNRRLADIFALEFGPVTQQATQMLQGLDDLFDLAEQVGPVNYDEALAAIEDAFGVQVEAFLDEILGPFETSGSQLEQDFADLLAHLADIENAIDILGLGADEAERFAIAAQVALERFWESATSGIQDIIDRLTGVESGRAAEDLYFEQAAVVDDLIARALEGDLSAIEQLGSEADLLLDLIGEAFGGEEAGVLQDQLLALLQDILGIDVTDLIPDLTNNGSAEGDVLGELISQPIDLQASDLIESRVTANEIFNELLGHNGPTTGGVIDGPPVAGGGSSFGDPPLVLAIREQTEVLVEAALERQRAEMQAKLVLAEQGELQNEKVVAAIRQRRGGVGDEVSV